MANMAAARIKPMLYQLSYEAAQLGAGQFVGLICSRGRTQWIKEMYTFEVRIIEEM